MTDRQPKTKAKTATIHRMVLPDHTCPFGVKALALLREKGFEVDDRILATRAETDAFMVKHGLETTPLILIGDEKIGGYDELRAYFEAQN